LERIRIAPNLSEPVRQRALDLAKQFVENPRAQYQASWRTVRRPDQDPGKYQLALRQAEAACRLVPDSGPYQITLGLAHYRLGNYAEAVRVLTRARGASETDSSLPACLAFLAMSQHHLGNREESQAMLQRLHELLRRSTRAVPEDAQAFLREAETLITPRD
jgi:tetratricopeptide (TPR) repeat protein